MVEESAEGVVNLDEGTRLALEKLSEMTGKDIILTADMDENGRIDRRDGKIYIRATLNGNYIMPVAMHESMHSIRKESPKDYALIRNFVVDYLFAKGNDVNKMIDRVESLYKDKVSTREDCLEEIVCNSIMAIAGDESAMKKALQVAKAEESILDKLANAIKNLAGKIKNFILTHTTNEAAKTFVKDVEALDKLAEMFSNAADNIKAKSEEVITNEQKNNTDKGVESGDVKYSIKENVKNKVSGEIYDKVVVLDTNIFKGIPPRNWGKTFRNFISKHLIGKKFLTFDENGKEEIIEFAKPNERVTKNGANNSHKVIDKLSRKSDINSKLVIVHSDEVINILEKQNENAEHSHQWLDENGWEFRNAFVMDKYGKIYSVTLNIAKSKDGRNILYDINKINEVGYGDVLSNAKGKRSSHINPNFVTNSISQSENNVNTKNNTDKGVDIKYSISDDVIKKFEIENINDYVHVQKQVLSTLNAENFFDDEGGKSKTVINKDSGMVIVINKKGIKETFNNKNYFNYSRNLKLAKLASIRKIPELIENGKLILDDEKNYHRNNSSIKYAYIVCETKINGKNANIKITVRKSPQNNKFWVHHIYIEKGTERTSAGTSKSSKTAFIPFGATNSISQSENNVNTKNDESSNDIKYSMGGLKAETADKSALEKAMKLEKDGTDSEKIRKETGWFKGYDGKWRFEIDNSELEFKTDIEKNRAAAIELAKMKAKSAEIEWKIVNDTATEAEENEYYSLDEKMVQLRKWQKLSDVINHPKLFKAYPQLKDVNVYYEISSLNRGLYSSKGNVIRLNPMCPIGEQKEIIIHEIQHAIQRIEDFANGSSLEYWENLGYSDEEAMAMYYNTAGEREARDVSARRDYNAEQRKNIRPDIDRKDVVFANSGDAGYLTDKDFTKYDNLETLDDKEIKVYNKRGWAYGLFNREDMKLLNEKFSELDKRLNGKTDNMLADGTRIVEVNNKIVSIGGTYNDPEIYSVLLINAENETYAEYIKGDVFDEIKCRKCNNVGMLEEIFRTVEFVQGKEDARFYNSFDYRYKKGRRDSGERATLPGDFSRYGYNKESNIRGTSDENAKGEVSAVQLDEDTSDIKYATDDTLNDWLDDESTPQGIDYEKVVEKNPVIAVAKIYKSAAQTAKSGLAQGKNVKLDEKEYLRIAGSIMQTYGIKGKYNPNYKKELASQLKNFVDSIGKKDANFTDLFEELVNDCKGGLSALSIKVCKFF